MVSNATEDPSLEKLSNAWKKVLLIEFIAIAIIYVFRSSPLQEIATYASALRI